MVKSGYKQTEVGVLPEDWAIKKLINLSDGGMQNGTFYEGSRKGTGVYFLNVGNLYQAAPIIPQTLGKFDASKDEIDRFRVKNGDLFFTRSSIVPSGIAYCNWYKDSGDNTTVFDSHVVRFKTDTDQVNPMYLYLQCVSQESRKYFISNAKVATMTTIDQAQIGNCLIPVPSLTEQKNIAEAISDADRIIRLLEKLIIKKKAIKQGAMQELLTGKRRLPGFSGEWRFMELGKYGTLIRKAIDPQSVSAAYFWEYSMPAFDGGKMPVKQFGSDMHSNRTVIYGRVLLFNKLNVRQKRIWLIDQCRENSVCSSEFLPYQSEKINLGLLVQVLSMKKVTLEFIGMSTGSSNSQKRITPDNFLEYKAFLPVDIDEQSAIAETLRHMDDEIVAFEEKLAKYRQVKQGMMQQLLTGKIRLM